MLYNTQYVISLHAIVLSDWSKMLVVEVIEKIEKLRYVRQPRETDDHPQADARLFHFEVERMPVLK